MARKRRLNLEANRTKIVKIVFSVLLLTAGWFSMSACSSLSKGLLKDPEVKVSDFKLVGIDSKGVHIDLGLNIKNPNALPLNLDEIEYALKVSGEQVTKGVFEKGISIPANGAGAVKVPLHFQFQSVGNLLSGIINRSFKKDYELNGTVKLGIFSIPFAQKGEIDINK